MTSPDLIHELKTSRPIAPGSLRAQVREMAVQETSRSFWPSLRLPVRRVALVAMPAAVALAIVSAGVLGLARSDGTSEAFRDQALTQPTATGDFERGSAESAPSTTLGAADSTIGPNADRKQRVNATVTLEVADPDAVSRAAQEALDLTRSLGGYVVSASVATGDEGSAALTVRVPVARVQEAIVQLSALGRIVSQQVTIDDLQEQLDVLERRENSLREQIARISARLESASIDAETRAVLEARRRALRSEFRQLRQQIASTNSEARMATIQLSVVTPDALGTVPTPTRLDRTLDEALNVLVWEGVVALAAAIVVAPFALLFGATWLGRRLYRRREEERLLAT